MAETEKCIGYKNKCQCEDCRKRDSLHYAFGVAVDPEMEKTLDAADEPKAN